MAEDLMAKLTGGQTGGTKGKFMIDDNNVVRQSTPEYTGDEYDSEEAAVAAGGIMPVTGGIMSVTGGRHRKSRKGHKGHKSNSWLAHVKATMKLHPGKSFKQVLKIAKKTYKRSQSQSSSQSQSQSQSGGKRRKGCKGGKGRKGTRKGQYGGSGGKMAGVGESASPYV